MATDYEWTHMNRLISCDDCKFNKMCSEMISHLSTCTKADYQHMCPVLIRAKENTSNEH